MIDEIYRYLSTPSPTDKINILDWWANRASEFPVLSRIAADCLAIQPTSTSCEILFSSAGNTTSGTRNRLDPETVDRLMCLNKWRKKI